MLLLRYRGQPHSTKLRFVSGRLHEAQSGLRGERYFGLQLRTQIPFYVALGAAMQMGVLQVVVDLWLREFPENNYRRYGDVRLWDQSYVAGVVDRQEDAASDNDPRSEFAVVFAQRIKILYIL